MGTDLIALDNNRMLGVINGSYKKEQSLAIDTLPKTLEAHKLSQILLAPLPTKNAEDGFSASLIVDHLPATLETHKLSQTLFPSEVVNGNEDSTSTPDTTNPLSFTERFHGKEVNHEMREKYFLGSHHNKFQENFKTSQEKDLQKERAPLLNEPKEKESTSCKLPKTFFDIPKAKEHSSNEPLERTQTEMMQPREHVMTKMQPKEKENLKHASSEKSEKQKELAQEKPMPKEMQLIKEKNPEMDCHHENHYRVERERKDQEGKGQNQQEQQKGNPKKKKEDKVFKVENASASPSKECVGMNESSAFIIEELQNLRLNPEVRKEYSIFLGSCHRAMHTFYELRETLSHFVNGIDSEKIPSHLNTQPLFAELSEVMTYTDEKMSDIFAVPEEQMDEQFVTDGVLYLNTSHLNIMLLFTELLKLIIENEKQERVSRRIERDLQLKYIQEVANNFEKTAASLQTTGIMGGIMGITAGVLPLFGFTKMGQSAVNYLGHAFDTFKGLKAMEACKRGSQILSSISKMNEETGKIRQTHAEGDRFKKQQFESLRRTDGDENTRRVQEYLQEFRELIQRILEKHRQEYELSSSLYAR